MLPGMSTKPGEFHTVQRDGVQTAAYTYDANGNRLARTAGDTPAIYDDQDRLVSSDASTFEYTPDGELKKRTSGSSETTYAYDEYRSLQKVTLPNGSEVN
jgi:YD repeat-containing protein